MSEVIAKVYKDEITTKLFEEKDKVDPSVYAGGLGTIDPIVKDGLVGWWPLAGDTKDYSGNGNDGVNNGAAVSAGWNGNLCHEFDGVDDSIVITGAVGIPVGSSDRTISGWFNQRGAGSSDMKPIIWIGTPTYLQTTGIGVRTSTNCIGSTLYGGSYENDSTIQATIGQWFFVAATYKTNGDFTLYVNGSQAAYRNIANSINTSPNVYIGREPGGRALNAYIQDVRIYNRALSPEEISQLYAAGPAQYSTAVQSIEFRENPYLLPNAYHIPLDDRSSGFTPTGERTLTPAQESNIVYDENGAWVGTEVTNLWPIKTGAMGWTGGQVTSSLSPVYENAIKHTLIQDISTTAQHTLASGNYFGSSQTYYTVSSYYRQNSGKAFSNPTKFVLASNTSGTEIARTDNSYHVAPMTGVYQRGWATASYTSSSGTAYPYIRWETPSGYELQSAFVGEMVEQNYFVSSWCPTSRGKGELTYNLHASTGLNWNDEYTIMYWKRPHGTDTRNISTGYNAESIGSSASGRHIWWGREQSSRKYGVNGSFSTIVGTYQYNWFLHVLRRVGTNFIVQVFLHTSKTPVYEATIGDAANTADYYVTPQGYDFRLGGRDAGYASNSYYRDIQVMNYALSDEEVATYFNTKYKVLNDHIPVGLMTEGVL
jgi:hypothetical protein